MRYAVQVKRFVNVQQCSKYLQAELMLSYKCSIEGVFKKVIATSKASTMSYSAQQRGQESSRLQMG